MPNSFFSCLLTAFLLQVSFASGLLAYFDAESVNDEKSDEKNDEKSEAEYEAISIPYFSPDSDAKEIRPSTDELFDLLAEPLDGKTSRINSSNKANHQIKPIRTASQKSKKSELSEDEAKPIPSESDANSMSLPPGVRRSFFQGISAETLSVLNFGGGDALSLTEGKANVKTGLPIPWIQGMMGLTGNFNAVYLAEKPDESRLPNLLYRTGTNLLLYKPLNSDWSLMLGAGISASSDFKTSISSKGIQTPLFTAARWQASPKWQWLFGAAYTDSADWKFIPFAGFTWLPNDDWKVEMTMPRPKVSRKMTLPFCEETFWGYAAGEYGGGSWEIERSWANGKESDNADLLKYRDIRFMLGLEPTSDQPRKFSWNAEMGVSFGRKIYFDGSDDIYRPDPGLVSRLNVSF